MVSLNDYVNRKGTTNPTGIVESINGIDGITGELMATVRWGVSDRRTYKDEVPLDQLQVVEEKIFSPVEVQRRQAKESGMPYRETEE